MSTSEAPAQDLEQRVKKIWHQIQEKEDKDRYQQLQYFLTRQRNRVVQEQQQQKRHMESDPSVATLNTSSTVTAKDTLVSKTESSAPEHGKRILPTPLPATGCTTSSQSNRRNMFSVQSYSKNQASTCLTIPSVKLPPPSEPPLPPYTTCIFIRKTYSVPDAESLGFVPYLGEGTQENGTDVPSDELFEHYDIEQRERRVEYGPEYQEVETNKMLDEALRRCMEQEDNSSLQHECLVALAKVTKTSVQRIRERYNNLVKKPSATAASTEKNSSTTTPQPACEDPFDSRYLKAIDSYRSLLCRRCYTYDCNLHGLLDKPSLQLQYELGILKEREGVWVPKQPNEDKQKDTNVNNNGDSSEVSPKDDDDNNRDSSVVDDDSGEVENEEDPFAHMLALSTFHKSICKRMFLIFEGDIRKMATCMRAPQKLVQEYVDAKQFAIPPLELVKPSSEEPKRNIPYFSVRNYKPAWYKAISNVEIRGAFEPCTHDEQCSEESCPCVQNHFFCTKACARGPKSPNFFRGCDCAGSCQASSCTCFAARRECDPDLCQCGTCSDPQGQCATKQKCRNDNIAMQRHCHVLVGRSTVKGAGFGLFTKYPLRKGQFVCEYVGELISHEEAERRGNIYDCKHKSFLFDLNADYAVDANRRSNKSRYMNHSERPNCEPKILFVHGDFRVSFFATQNIDAQSELFFDYGYKESVSWMKSKGKSAAARKRAAEKRPMSSSR